MAIARLSAVRPMRVRRGIISLVRTKYNAVNRLSVRMVHDTAVDSNTFLFGEKMIKFTDLEPKMNDQLAAGLSNNNKFYATTIQSKVYGPIMNKKKDIIIGAETGSGKTLAYLIPILQYCMNKNLQKQESNDDNNNDRIEYPTAVILVPSKELCQQVYNMASDIVNAMDTKLVTVDVKTTVANYWPYTKDYSPNILICTPAFLSKFIKGPIILNEDLFRSIQHIVLDEADMLLDGSYITDIEKILDAFKVIRRNMIKEQQLGLHDYNTQVILSAATLPSRGEKSIKKFIAKKFPNSINISNSHLHQHHPRILQTFYEVNSVNKKKVPAAIEDIAEVIEETNSSTLIDDALVTCIIDSINDKASSMPPHLVIDAPTDTTNSRNGIMVFVNTAQTCAVLAQKLRDANIECAEFHSLLPSDVKVKELDRFKAEQVRVLVCTDSAARGFDFLNVGHVIQAEFALNVVQYLHRIGRASRGGKLGKATNFFNSSSKELVASIVNNDEVSDGTNEKKNQIEQSFSRRRGFRKTIKRAIKRQNTQE